MYRLIKQLTKALVPNQIIRRNKSFFRSIVYQFYKGNTHACNLCHAKLKRFVKLANNDLLCPNCGSLPRTRRLYQILEEKKLIDGKILHFSPPQSLSKKIKQFALVQYTSSDFENEFTADAKYDLTAIPIKNESINLFIAYHVLEHIESDITAMKELFRITKLGGKGLIQTPFKLGNIYEDASIKTPTDRLIHFGQKDHVRIYSAEGLSKRLENVGFSVEVLSFVEQTDNYFGFKSKEVVLLVKKTKNL